MTMKRVDEGSDATLVLTFYDAAGVLTTPSSIEYRVDCLDNRMQLRDWTSVPPNSQVDVDLTPEDNESVMVAKSIEVHEVTVRAEHSGIRIITGRFQYEVQNLRFLP